MNNIPLVFWLIPVASIVALGMAWYFFRTMMKEEEGTDRMKEIAAHVRKGAMAYLKQQYKVVGIVFIVLAIIFSFMAYVLEVQNPWVPFAFLTGGLFSGLSGFFGMKTATYASARTANGARTGLDKGLKTAFRSGAVMGLVVVGLGLLDIAIWFLVLNAVYADEKTALITITTTMLTFGMGASTQQPTWEPTSWEKWKPTYRRMTPATLPPSPTTWATTWATWLEWEPTCMRAIADLYSPLLLSAPRHSP